MTKIPPDDILEGLYKLRIRECDKRKTVLELYDLETHQKKLGPDYLVNIRRRMYCIYTFMCVPRSLYIDTSPIVSADALTKPYNSASAELSATTACGLHHIFLR